ncbi:MAG: hypothetical protein H6R35_487, partial [Bacteroidetes bacterium]|nr:hypothetical protein [Bacteroidota bacterium]
MKKIIMPVFGLLTICLTGLSQSDADDILKKVEKNMSSDNRVFESSMTIRGNRT